MSDPTVDRWKQKGQVALWRLRPRRERFEWHLAADNEACRALAELIELMKAARWPSQKAIVLAHPERTATCGPNDRPPKFAAKLCLKYAKDSGDDELWEFTVDESLVRLVLGRVYIDEFARAVDDMSQGRGDYAIGPKRDLWIWWW